jgi:hypothetical protein
MIIVRNIFQLKFGKASEAKALWQKGIPIMKKTGLVPSRILMDVTGPYYTLVMELQFKSLAEFERSHSTTGNSAAWRAWYKKFTALVESGHREIFQTVD